MIKHDTGDKSLNQWLIFFQKPVMSNSRFLSLLKKIDKSYLTECPSVDPEHPLFTIMPVHGMLEGDFKKIAFDNDIKKVDEKTRIVMALFNQANFSSWQEKYGELFSEVLEKSLIEGDYEKYDIPFEKVVSMALKRKFIDQDQFMGISLLRGMLLGSRYPDEEAEKKLQKTVKKNKWRMLLGK